MLWFRSHLATVVAVGLLRAVDAQGRGCADLGALIPVEWPAYDPEVMGLLPQGRTYCDMQTTGDFYCDECPESCLTVRARPAHLSVRLSARAWRRFLGGHGGGGDATFLVKP